MKMVFVSKSLILGYKLPIFQKYSSPLTHLGQSLYLCLCYRNACNAYIPFVRTVTIKTATKINVGMFHTCNPQNTNSVSETSNILQTVGLTESSERVKKISKSMKAYLDRAKQHDEFLIEKKAEFEIGRRHLANMMGLDANSMTQEDIDKAIEYLLPSGLYDKKARPLMKPPEEIFPKKKSAEFDFSGRPFNTFFYTRIAHFYQLMHEVVEKFIELDKFEDKMLRKGIKEPPQESILSVVGTEFLKKEDLSKQIIENINDIDYNFFVKTMERLIAHPYSFRVKDFIYQFVKPLTGVTTETVPDLIYDETGRPFLETEGARKTSRAKVIVRGNGTGKIEINGSDLSYFTSIQDREQLIFPLQFTNLLGKVDVEATVREGGHSSQAGAVRYALSLALRSFLSSDDQEKMRIAGLLTLDKRRKERKKPGQEGARRKYTWKKR